MDFFYHKRQAVLALGLMIGMMVFCHTSWAQTLEEQRLQSRQKFNFLNDVTLDTNPQPLDSIDNSSGMTYTLGIKYSPVTIKRSNVWLLTRISKRFNGEEILGLLDTIIRFEKSVDTFMGWVPRFRVDVTLPTNEFMHEQTSFVGAGSAQVRLGRSLLTPKLYVLWLNTLRWNFHQYRVSEIGAVNIQNTLSSFGVANYSVTEKLQVGAEFGWAWARTYGGNIRNNYLLGGYASYVITPEWSATMGASTQASPLTADGQSSNIKFFNERFTTTYLSVTHFM